MARAAARSGEWAQHFSNASCLLNGRYFTVDDQSRPLFSDSTRDFATATNFVQNWQNGLHSAGWRSERVEIWQFRLKKIFNGNTVATSCAKLMKIGA